MPQKLSEVSLCEEFRPQFHFTAPSGWLNDPNGLVYHDGKYHLFYQHNPFGTEWGNMTWGHAVSTDLIHWKDLPNAIEPDSLGTIFSGSAVVDRKNTSKLGSKATPALVCLYTAAGDSSEASKGKPFTQCLAYSLDGETFVKYPGNPVVKHISKANRDPKVVWHKPSKQWIMTLYLDKSDFEILGSTNLTDWNRLSRLELAGSDECPDFFQLPLNGNMRNKKWVFSAANGNYQVGTFDGKVFHPETSVVKSHFGNTGYAGQTFSDEPKKRRIQIEWMRGSDFPGCPWNQQMTFPNMLSLKSTSKGPRLRFWPIPEIYSLRLGAVNCVKGVYDVPSGLMDLVGEWAPPTTGVLEISVNGKPIRFDAATRTLSALGCEVQLPISEKSLSLRVLADRASLEIYMQRGMIWAPLFHLPHKDDHKGVTITKTGNWPGHLLVHELKSAATR